MVTRKGGIMELVARGAASLQAQPTVASWLAVVALAGSVLRRAPLKKNMPSCHPSSDSGVLSDSEPCAKQVGRPAGVGCPGEQHRQSNVVAPAQHQQRILNIRAGQHKSNMGCG